MKGREDRYAADSGVDWKRKQVFVVDVRHEAGEAEGLARFSGGWLPRLGQHGEPNLQPCRRGLAPYRPAANLCRTGSVAESCRNQG